MLEPYRLAFAEYALLEQCVRRPAMPTEIARAVGITPAGATDLIGRMVRRGLAVRGRHPVDRRAFLIRPTPRGRRLYRQARLAERRFVRHLGRTMSRRESVALAFGLRGLERALSGVSVPRARRAGG